jgi:pSer/pThr/pTyr-binding forkhead associated (FHA) protein
MASLHILMSPGPNQGKVIELTDRCVIGRNPDCGIIIPGSAVSREHALILRVQGRYHIEDLHSRNGTHVNNTALANRVALRNNDGIRICDFFAIFREQEPVATSTVVEEQFKTLSEGSDKRRGQFQLHPSVGAGVEADCWELRNALKTNHVFHVHTAASALPKQLVDPASCAVRVLRRGYYRLVVLDAAKGLSLEIRAFDLERFLRHAYERMVQVFGLPVSTEHFHVENVGQILKDELRSLFCFLNLQHIPIADLRRLRGFTQEVHQVLFLCCGVRDLGREEAWLDD